MSGALTEIVLFIDGLKRTRTASVPTVVSFLVRIF
jgi:hypothetical protein